jgi:hypothetical protein
MAHRRENGALRCPRTLALVVSVVVLAVFITLGTVLPSTLAEPSPSSPRNVILFYDNYSSSTSLITREIARPLVAHLDQEGKPTDWMFDSFIFYSSMLYYTHYPTQSYIDSWIKYLFDGGQIANLDGTVAEVKIALGQPDYRMNVFLTVPVVLNATETSGIFANVDTMLSRWNTLNPRHLNLVGFYWGYTESPGKNQLIVTPVENLISSVAIYLHSKNLKLLMIPYLDAIGYDRLHSLGVDYVTTQPNYAWDTPDNPGVFATVNDRIVAGYSDGAEFELPRDDGEVKSCGGDWRCNLEVYLKQGYTYLWNRNAINTYYHGSDISFMGRSANADDRTAYERIYEYIRSTHSRIAPSATPIVPANGTIVSSMVELKVHVTLGGIAIQGATVRFYIDGLEVGSAASDQTGYASYIYNPTSGKEYSWHATAEVPGYDVGSSPTGAFVYATLIITRRS